MSTDHRSDEHMGDLRSLAQQDEAELGGPMSVLVRQKRDHVRLDELLHGLGSATPDEQDVVLRNIYRLVFSHAFAEEAVLWPVIRRMLPDGERLTLQVEQEHQEVNELVTAIETTSAGSTERQALIDRLVEVLREDVRDEEDELLPRLQARASLGQLRRLGVAWQVVRSVAPTRPHPVVARRPPGNAPRRCPSASSTAPGIGSTPRSRVVPASRRRSCASARCCGTRRMRWSTSRCCGAERTPAPRWVTSDDEDAIPFCPQVCTHLWIVTWMWFRRSGRFTHSCAHTCG